MSLSTCSDLETVLRRRSTLASTIRFSVRTILSSLLPPVSGASAFPSATSTFTSDDLWTLPVSTFFLCQLGFCFCFVVPAPPSRQVSPSVARYASLDFLRAPQCSSLPLPLNLRTFVPQRRKMCSPVSVVGARCAVPVVGCHSVAVSHTMPALPAFNYVLCWREFEAKLALSGALPLFPLPLRHRTYHFPYQVVSGTH